MGKRGLTVVALLLLGSILLLLRLLHEVSNERALEERDQLQQAQARRALMRLDAAHQRARLGGSLYEVSALPAQIGVGDFDGDHVPDVVVTYALSESAVERPWEHRRDEPFNPARDTVSVLLGRPDGTLCRRTDLVVPGGPHFVHVCDLNRDGLADIVVSSFSTSTVNVLLSNGKQGWAPQQGFASGAFPCQMASTDFNGDGKPDLVVANRDSDTLSLLLGNGDGSFGAKKDIRVPRHPFAVAVGDFNGDGEQDVAVGGESSTISVLLGRGNGQFSPRIDSASGFDARAMIVDDFDRDGRADLAVLDQTGKVGADRLPRLADPKASNVSLLLGQGNGHFARRVDHPLASAEATLQPACQLLALDTNRDGKLDLLAVGSRIEGLEGQGDGRFVATAGNALSDLASVLGRSRSSGGAPKPRAGAEARRPGSDRALPFLHHLPAELHPGHLALADFNRDGALDLVACTRTPSALLLEPGTAQRPRGQAETTPLPPSGVVASVGAPVVGKALAVGDFNGDGRPDLAVAVRSPREGASLAVRLLGQRRDGSFRRLGVAPVGHEVNDLAFADVNGDGKLDLLALTAHAAVDGKATCSSHERCNALCTLTGDGKGRLRNQGYTHLDGVPLRFVVADVDGDSKVDVVVEATRGEGPADGKTTGTGPGSRVIYLQGHGDGSFVQRGAWDGERLVGVGDVDGDHRVDIVTLAPRQLHLRSPRGQAPETSPPAAAQGTPPSGLDKVTWVESTHAVPLDALGPLEAWPFALADLDLDGKLDLVAPVHGGRGVLLRGRGNGSFDAPLAMAGAWGTGTATVLDLDGDSRPDLLSSGPDALLASYRLGGRDGSPTPPVLQVGLSPRGPRATWADINGDHRPDLIWCGPSQGTEAPSSLVVRYQQAPFLSRQQHR